MSLTAKDKIKLNHRIVDALQLRLLDKSPEGLPEAGKYYYPNKPHDLSTIGSLAPQPTQAEMQGQFPPAPNSMGMVFLVIPDENGEIKMSVSGHFDLEHAYIPDYDDMISILIMQGETPRDRQDVPEAFVRYGLNFKDVHFTIDTTKSTSGTVSPTNDRITEVLDAHLTMITQDPRVFCRRRAGDASGVGIRSIEWDDQIVNQEILNQRIREHLFEPDSTPLSYNISLECRYRHIPSLSSEQSGDAMLIELHLVNHTKEETANEYRLYRHRVMDAGFTTSITVGTHSRMLFNLAPREYRYRDSRWIDGYGQACGLTSPTSNVLSTQILPRFEQPWMEAPTAEQVGMSHSTTFEGLSLDPIPILEDLVTAMQHYLFDWEKEVAQFEKNKDSSAHHAREDSELFKKEIKRIQDGTILLKSDGDLLQSFMLMNRVMGRAIKMQGKPFSGWRLFQIAFIVSQLGSVKERMQTVNENPLDSENYADVLWFATGGGKTEAYLGLITIAMFYQRLNQRYYGVTAWLRFPLRMLSVQQFQRLSYVLGQANEVKAEKGIPGHPFTVGYFTGGGTPGRISSTASYAANNYLPNIVDSEEHKQSLRFINRCPHCGDRVEISFETRNFRIKHVCQNSQCWSNTQSPLGEYGEGVRGELGIFVSDEECYRYLPTVLVGTLDKLAVLGHNQNFHKFFGHATHYCPDHGFITQGSCKDSIIDGSGLVLTCPNNSTTAEVKTKSIPPLIDPGFSFLITDELHLLGESLGNFDAHYETLLCHLQQQNNGIAPKILGATATIREYENHIHHLYLRAGRRFPVAGRTRLENFYSRVRYEDGEMLCRRLYVGMLPIATGPAPVANVIANANQLYHYLLADLIAQAENDPASFSKMMGISAESVKEAREHLINNLQPTLVYSISTANVDQIMKRFDDDNAKRRENSEPVLVAKRLDGHTDLAEIQDVIEKVEINAADDPVHEIVATSVVSHGVDIERLNMEFFTGWPKTTAEYLQSSSRSGRTHPGIILAGLSYFKLYEYSIYSRFSEYHRFMERLIEAVPINRFAPNVLSRTLPGVFSAILFNWARHQDWGQSINPYASESIRQAIKSNDEIRELLVNQMLASLNLPKAKELNVFSNRMIIEFELDLKRQAERIVDVFRNLPSRYSTDSIFEVLKRMNVYAPLQSFRDIDKQVSIKPEDHNSARILASVSR